MLLRFSLSAAGALLLASLGSAQTVNNQALPTMGVKDAGVYHMATGEWTRGPLGAAAWDDIIYDNSCGVGYYGPHAFPQRYVEDGRIPSTTSPENPGPPIANISWTGTMDQYTVNYFELAYCCFDPLPTYEVFFWDCFSGCADATLLTPTAAFTLTNMPGSIGTAGACWTVGIDLANAGLAFTLQADCDGAWNGGGGVDTFGWGAWQASGSLGGTPGPIIKGDRAGYLNGGPGSSGCDIGANTVFYNGSDINNSEGTGLNNLDQWEVDNMTPTPAYFICYWYGGYFSGNLYGSFHMRIGAETGGPTTGPGYAYCPGDGVAPATPCPCNNNNSGATSPFGGCHNSLAATFPDGAKLDAAGTDSFGNPDVIFTATGVPNNFGIFFGANNQTNGGNGTVFGDGLRCAGGALVRMTSPTMASGNTAVLPAPAETLDVGAAANMTRNYQYWYRDPGGPCGTVFNLTNGYSIDWLP